MKFYDISVILKLLCISLCKACKPAEYKIDKECCPMCAAGTHVSKHCDRELGTNCIPCIGSTYTNVPNGLSSCFTCTVCDEGHGLKVKKKCESVSDAVCEPLPRYYCIDVFNGSCRKGREHSTCLPGQYINQTGTASKDTVCSDCPAETYSDGSFTRCKLHTIKSETVCNPCPNSTYTDVPNGLMACLICTVCDKGHGLTVKSNCISVSDAVCEPLPQHYCIENHGKGCRNAREHSTCLPGQYIKQTGTALEDTVCKDCSDETYSDGSLMQCKPHKNCESLGQRTVTQGTRSSDAMCGQESSHLGLIVGILLSALLVIVIAIVIVLKKKKKFTI
ncbi:hypothetical protein C0J50_5166 [Silurus asotus]|uniref:TNFR-Cys domain-containing protein n=1 Tax=Silurus asotus TaxID=30991 RepID=A0AAD5A5G1_SILAS|nr:hypothetical protein C0J50_5166 [Silurus asotus]